MSSAIGNISTGPAAGLRDWITGRAARHYFDLVAVLLAKEFRVRYKSTVLGYAWSVMHPLAFAMVFYMLFGVVMRFGNERYIVYLIAGLFPWQCLSNTIIGANFYFLGNSSLIKKVNFNRAILVLAGVLNETVHFVVSIPVIMLIMWIKGLSPSFSWLWLVPLLIVIQTVMSVGIALAVATCNLFFRDLERLTTIFMHLFFYITPIIYPVTKLTEANIDPMYRWMVLWLNPFSPLVQCWHDVFYNGVVEWTHIAGAGVWAIVCLAIGVPIYRAMVWRFAEIV